MDTKRDRDARAQVAALQASWLFLILAVLPLTAVPMLPSGGGMLVAVALGNLAAALVIRSLPWRRWPESAKTWQLAPIIATLAVTSWSAGPVAVVTGPFYVLVFAWLGLHHSARAIMWTAPVAATAYGAALFVTGARVDAYGSIVVLFPIGTFVGVLIARHVAELRAAQLRILAEERWRAAIMATLAHDVRSPLTTIIGTLEVLQDDADVPIQHAPLVAAATRQAQRIMRLATGLLEVERVEQGALRLDRHTVSLGVLANEVADATNGSLVRVEVDPQLTVWADRERLEQILVNLTGNALRHGLPPVVIDAGATHTDVWISVRDHGRGVPPAHAHDLFDRLQSSDQSAHSVGLGLWIVRLLAEAHGGSVTHRATSPGSEFVVRLPRPTREPDVRRDPVPEVRPAALLQPPGLR